MNKAQLRERLEEYRDRGPTYAHIIDEMFSMTDYDLGSLMFVATGEDGFQALAAINLMPLMFGQEGVSCVALIANMWDGIGAVHARQMMDYYHNEEAPELTEVGSSAPVTGRA
jgi:hypothetical protein